MQGTPFGGGSPVPHNLVIPAHTSSGTLQVRYRPNDLDDPATRFVGLTAYALSGIETDQYIGGATIIDDDPTPALSVTTGQHRITAGDRATWTATLDKPVDYFAYVVARPVKAVDGPQLRVGDLPKRFRERYLGQDADLGLPLYKSRLELFVQISQRKGIGTFTLPTRPQHGVTRAVSFEFRTRFFDVRHPIGTVKVLPS